MKRIVHLVFACSVACFAAIAPALANDAFTGVPVYPGVTDREPATGSSTCPGKLRGRVSVFTWSAATADSPDRIAGWYHGALLGSAIAHHDDGRYHVLVIDAADGSSGASVSRAGTLTVLRLYSFNAPPGDKHDLVRKCKLDD